MNFWHWLIDSKKEKHADIMRDKTHDALNELQVAMLRYQQQNRASKERIIDILSSSDEELESVAYKISEVVRKTQS